MACASNGSRYRLFIYSCIILAFVSTILINGHAHSHDDGDDHDHGNGQPASFKYSREANEQAEHEHVHDDVHSHGGHDHGHAHEGHDHGHAHEGHDHGHAHGGHDHGHAHGGHDHGHAHEGHDHGHAHGGHGHAHDGHHEDHTEEYKKWENARPKETKPKTRDWFMWMKALGATAFISISPVFILLVIPLENTSEHQSLLKVLLSFASGGLLGDAFLHLIPHAVSPHSHGGDGHGHSHDHGHSHGGDDSGHNMSVGLWVLAGIIAFLIVEKTVRFIKGDGHGHSHAMPKAPKQPTKLSDDKDDAKKDAGDDKDDAKKDAVDVKEEDKKTEVKAKSGKEKSKKEEIAVVQDQGSDIKVAGYLNLAADFAHNFTDGLAIGASFLVSQNVGIITTITIFLHEIPHEIGDFAILVQSGCTKQKAMMLQFSTAIGAMLGTLCSLFAEGIGERATAWILPFTAGGFIYIATVSVIPELLVDCKPSQSVKEIGALLVGVYMMVLISQFE